jgi:hypothetical protein
VPDESQKITTTLLEQVCVFVRQTLYVIEPPPFAPVSSMWLPSFGVTNFTAPR